VVSGEWVCAGGAGEEDEVKEVKDVKEVSKEELMRVLVTFAVEAEFAPWRKRWPFEIAAAGGIRFWRADIDDCNVTVLLTAMGTLAAVLTVDTFLRKENEDKSFAVCISSGLAGALRETLGPGDIIAPRMLVPETVYPERQENRLEVNAALRELALKCGAKGTDCLWTADQVLVKAADKKIYSSRAEAVDMESFGIATEAGAWGLRTVVVRAISDSVVEDLPLDFNRTLSDNEQISVSKVLIQLAKRPSAIPAMVKFGLQSRRAAESLATFLDKYLRELSKVSALSGSNEMATR
jgi:nucleoside phosphorylase